MKISPDFMDSLIHYFHNSVDGLMDAISQMVNNLLVGSVDRKAYLDIFHHFFFSEAANIKASSLIGDTWRPQLEKLT